MNNKFKRVLMLLFVVSTLLLMIGSVCANDVELNDNLETSLDLDDGLSVGDSSISNPNSKVSSQLTASNIDEETDTSQSVEEDLIDLNSNDVVSNDDTTINAKDSDKNIKTANQLSDAQFGLVVKPLNDSVKVGQNASFEVIISNLADESFAGIIPMFMQYNEAELHYVGYVSASNNILGPENVDHFMWDQKKFGFDFSQTPFEKGSSLSMELIFEAKAAGEPGNFIFIETGTGNNPTAITTTKVIEDVPPENIQLITTVSHPISNIGDVISFEIFAKNTGAPLTVDYIPINVLYRESELAFVGFTRGASSGRILDPVTVPDWCDHKIFNCTTDGTFKTGDYFNFTVQFKVNSANSINPGIFVTVDAGNNPTSTSTTKLDSYFDLVNIALNTANNPGGSGNVNLGSNASFEIFARNIGSAFTQDVVPIDVYYNPSMLKYVGFTPGLNPDAGQTFADHYLGPIVDEANGHLLFGFTTNFFGYPNFDNGYIINFTVNFETLKVGEVGTTAVINWTQSKNYSVSASNKTVVGQDADFKLEYKPSALIVNVNDVVSYDVIATNLGGDYYGWVGIDILYNPEELEYINFTPNFNPDNYKTHDGEGNPTPNPIDRGNGHLYFGYMATPVLGNGHIFNFTVNFKPLKAGEDGKKFMSDASIDWWQIEHHYVNSSAYVFATDADFVLDIIPSTTDLLKVGDTVSFDVIAHNREGSYYGSYIGFDLFFNPDELGYTDFIVNEKPSGTFKLESGGLSSPNYKGLLGAFSLTAENGHLHFGFRPSEDLLSAINSDDGDNADCYFNFTINYDVLSNGLLENDAQLSWANSEDQTVYSSAAVSAGEESFILTKTPLQDKVQVGGDVYFDIYLENTGADIYDGTGRIVVNDWYPGGELQYIDYTINSNSTPVSISKDNNFPYHLMIYQSLTNRYWRNGDYLNVTLHFKVVEPGVHCNHVFFRKNSTTGTVFTGEPNLELNKTVQNEVADVGDLIYFDIYLENKDDSIPYYDHVHETTDVIITDVYPDSLEYAGFKVNDDSQKNGKVSVTDNGGNVTIKYTPDGSRWKPGNYINITLIFKAVKSGQYDNVANFDWKWKDVGSEESIDLLDGAMFVIGTPDFALEKISNFETAKVGDLVSFTIIYTNNGTLPLTGVYIVDNEWTEGLVYQDYSDKDLWTFDGKDTWYYNSDLQPGDAAVLELTFKATTPGEKNNTAVAGNNEMDETKNSTDIVLIKEKESDSEEDADEPDGSEEPDEEDDVPIDKEPTEDEPNEEPTTPVEKAPVTKSAALPNVGNPLFVLLLALLTLCFVPLRGKK